MATKSQYVNHMQIKKGIGEENGSTEQLTENNRAEETGSYL